MINLRLIFNSLMLGFGLAMDAFSVSLANGLNEVNMKKARMFYMASIFGLFQAMMPLIGYFIVIKATQTFQFIQPFIPWIALILLSYIGIKMIFESRKCTREDSCHQPTNNQQLFIQAIATSIDALSVGLTIADASINEALFTCLTIGLVTFIVCYVGIIIGKKAGTKLANKAALLGGSILIVIGLEIFITHFI